MRRANAKLIKGSFFLLKIVLITTGLFLLVNALQLTLNYRMSHSNVDDPLTATARDIQKQLQCLTQNIYWEAAHESFEGKVAVAQVTMNRVESGKFPDSVCGVVYQKNTFVDKVVCQFSWFCENNHVTRPVHQKQFAECEEVAKMVLLEKFRLPSMKEALYYHADYVNPKWNKQRITQIGRHIFYKES